MLPGHGWARSASAQLRCQRGHREPVAGGDPRQEGLGKQLDVPVPLPEGRQGQGHDVEPVVQILPEVAPRGRGGQIEMGRADHADVHLPALLPSHPANGPRLERPQQLRLQLERQGADLVEEERASVGQLEEPGLGGDGSGKGASLVAEQLALEQVGRDRRAVDLDERLGARALP